MPRISHISQSDAADRLAQYTSGFVDAHVEAIEKYQDNIGSLLANPSSTAQATVIHELVVEGVARRFDGAPGVDFITRSRRKLMLLAPTADDPRPLIVQFKKLDGLLLSRNYPTRTAQLFARQEHLSGIPPASRLTVGYRLDGETLLGVHVTLPSSARYNAWDFELDLATGSAFVSVDPAQTVLPFVAPPLEQIRLKAKPELVGTPAAADEEPGA